MAKPAKTPPNQANVPRRPHLALSPDQETNYANMVRIAHTPAEYVFDFARFLPGDRGAKVVSRILMSPLGAKLLLSALTENVAKYEKMYGEIQIPKKQTLADFLFTPPAKPGEEEKDDKEDNKEE